MKTYEISEKLLNELLEYLVQRPYAEVAKGVEQLRNLPEVGDRTEIKLVEKKEP